MFKFLNRAKKKREAGLRRYFSMANSYDHGVSETPLDEFKEADDNIDL